ncbi:chymotrypsinogen A-like [Sinocyclocheilus rhinocerous]|uniref:chymotrypsinogen A-like n=1 Tax=Sinocyclocheilus rhinocerous TaxID=307959 RepID=UPI0007B79588|nr:PREDICTED: chymotrypsinogen A-like [Sinocyclocheilus rhinocerous]
MRAWPVYDGHQSPHFGVACWLDWVIGQLPVTEVPAIHMLRGPIQEDTNGSLQSEDISAPAVQQLPSIERLRPLADYWFVWRRLHEILQWVLHTIRHGYTILFRKGPPPFSGVISTMVRPCEASALSQEIVSLLEKGAIEEVITHPLYNRATFNNDIALLKLSAPVTFTPRISPVCLAPSNTNIVPGTRCFTTGWGQTATTTSPEILQQTVVPIISPAVCRQIWSQSRITDTMICAGASGSSSCQGDSGGPLVCESSGVWTLVGSVSWERSTCDPRFPAVYASVSQLRSWIDMTISSN